MNQVEIDKLNSAYGLGEVTHTPESITGGLLHKMWKLETDKGVFALKVLNPEIMRRPNILTYYEQSEKIARQAAQANIPAVTALIIEGNAVLKIDDDFVMVFPWIEGRVLTDKQITLEQAEIIGSLLAKIHQLNLSLPETESPKPNETTVEYWKDLFVKTRAEGIILDENATDAIGNLVNNIEKFSEDINVLDTETVVSHCDLDKKNVIWEDSASPKIIDWESAGYVNSQVELMIVSLDWADMKKDSANIGLFKSVVTGYKKSGKKLSGSSEVVFYSAIGATLDWLEFNIRRSYEDQFGADERQLGRREVVKTMSELKLLEERKEEIIASFNE